VYFFYKFRPKFGGDPPIKIWGPENPQFRSVFHFASALLRNRPRYRQSKTDY